MHALKLVILGRDGILNQFRENHVTAPEEWQPVPGALEAVARLTHAGWHVVVATNQSGIGRGMIDMAAVNAVHAHMNQQLMAQGGRVDAIFFCPHTPEDECECRKPRAELQPFDRGDAEDRRGKPVLDAVEHGVSEPCGKADCRTLDHAANGIPRVGSG